MINKVAFLCTDPWERFLPVISQSHSKEYFDWLCRQVRLRKQTLCSQELVEIYGENKRLKELEIFEENEQKLQFLYVQSQREQLLEKVFEKSDIVIMGLPGCKREFEKMFLIVSPWRDKILFLWDQQYCRGKSFLKQLCNEYKIRETQVFEIKKNTGGTLRQK